MPGYGFTSCGYTTANVGTTERFDDTANTHTLRANAVARRTLAGYSFGGYGFTSCGYTTSCLLYTSPSPRDRTRSRMPSSA